MALPELHGVQLYYAWRVRVVHHLVILAASLEGKLVGGLDGPLDGHNDLDKMRVLMKVFIRLDDCD